MTREQFWDEMNDWGNHRILLWYALEETGAGEVVELGCGRGSTGYLHDYCQEAGRHLYSYDTSEKYMEQFEHLAISGEYYPYFIHSFKHIINEWNIVKDEHPEPSVILIDNAPGYSRVEIIKWFADFPGIMVIHDTQPPPTAADYGYERIWKYWKYKVDLDAGKNHEPKARGDNRTWASAVSNYFDVTKWAGMETGRPDYRIK